VVAGLGLTVSALMLLSLQRDTSFVVLGLAYLVFGIGFGSLNAPITNAAVSGMPRAQAGVASAVTSTSRQIGTTLGVAVFGALVLGRLDEPLASGLTSASHAGWALMVGCGMGVLAVGLLCTTPWALRTRTACAHLDS